MADVLNPHNEASSSAISSNSESTQLSFTNLSECSTPKSMKRVRKNITDYFDRLNENEEENINKALAQFIFGCNLPFSIVE